MESVSTFWRNGPSLAVANATGGFGLDHASASASAEARRPFLLGAAEVMRWPWSKPETRAAAPYSDAVLAAILSDSRGGDRPRASTTGAVEAAASLAARAFASAKLTPPVSAVTPLVLSTIGREIIRRGECLFLIDVDGAGLRLTPAVSWDVAGGPEPETWTYRVRLAGPSHDVERIAPFAGVVHVRAYIEPSAPWRGVSPLDAAASTARLLAETETALADESSGARGYLLPVPQGDDEDNEDDSGPLAGLKADIASLRGKTALVETTAAGWGEGRGAAPSQDWKPQRIGANPPDSLRQLRQDAEAAVLGATGTPVELIAARSDGAAVREAWRRYAHAFLSPIGEIVAAEMAEKLDVDGLALDFSSLFASDITGRARAFGSMVQAGMDIERAAGLSGLLAGAGE